MTLTFFTSRKLTKACHQETNGKSNLEQLAQSVMEAFPEAMREYAHLGRSIYQARLEVSGKKFKKCCSAAGGTGPGPIFH